VARTATVLRLLVAAEHEKHAVGPWMLVNTVQHAGWAFQEVEHNLSWVNYINIPSRTQQQTSLCGSNWCA
jgi:hypothetical protein